MKAVILVGGKGLRLRPLTCNTPKSMVPLVNRPFMEHVVNYLKRHHISEIIFALCYLPDRIQSHFGDGSDFGMSLTYVVEESPLGTGGAVKNVAHLLEETVVVLNGDLFTDLDLRDMIGFHRSHKAQATIALTRVKDPTAFGVVEIDAQGRVERFVEKPSREAVTSNLINAGIYILEPELLAAIPSGVHCMLEREFFPQLVEKGVPFFGYRSDAYWIDVGTPHDYLRLHRDFLTGKVAARFPGRPVVGGIWIEDGCNIHSSAVLTGPLVIGRDCTVGQEVRISGPAVIGPGCTIGQGTIIERSILWHNVQLGKQLTIRDCIVCDNSVIGDNAAVPQGSILSDDTVTPIDTGLGRGARSDRGTP